MKTSQDPRHQKRITLMEQLFSYSFNADRKFPDIADVIAHLPAIDALIQKNAPEWPLAKIAKIDLAILRLATWELTVVKDAPAKVIIDEAVELSKSYGNEGSSKFINGALGAIMK